VKRLKYVLTGGPGTGKSSIILALEQMGEYVVREAAEDVITVMQARGIKEPWREQGFQDKILALQIQREERIPKEAKRIFIDRSAADGLAYTEPGTSIHQRVLEESRKRRYDKIFLIEQLGFTEKTKVRRECHEEALQKGKMLEDIYKQFGYDIIRILAGPLDERVTNILKEI
jgi:predicted ATPase